MRTGSIPTTRAEFLQIFEQMINRGRRPGVGAAVGGRRQAAQWPALAGVVVIAACLDVLQLAREGYANTYYASAVRSMTQGWHNFFFVAFDPGGFISIDKPPLGFWIQSASALVLGFHGWSLLLPQAIAGVCSVVVLFFIVRRTFGPLAGLIAALALALTPISVATNRNNTIDSLLTLLLVLAGWAALNATATGRLRLLVLSLALVGAGFNIKFLEAYLALPAIALVYLVGAPLPVRTRLLHLTVAGAVLLAISFVWIAAVDFTPASQRPYVGSSSTNSELELALGRNGLQKLLGGSRDARRPDSPGPRAPSPEAGASAQQAGPAASRSGLLNVLAGPNNVGSAGVFRLFGSQLGGQIAWLIPLALLGLVTAWRLRLGRRLDAAHRQLVLWGCWLATCAVFFSAAASFQRYYLTIMAPAIAALFGIGVVALWQAFRASGARGWLLPLSLLAAAGLQAYVLRSYPGWSAWLAPTVVVPCLAAAATLLVVRLQRLRSCAGVAATATALGAAALLVVPAVWSGETVRNNAAAAAFFSAGPAMARSRTVAVPRVPSSQPTPNAGGLSATPVPRRPAGRPPSTSTNGDTGPQSAPATTASPGTGRLPLAGLPTFLRGPAGGAASGQLRRYLVENRHGAGYLLAVTSTGEVEQLILDTGLPVMALGGYTGSDPILTEDTFAAMVAAGEVRYVWGGAAGNPQAGIYAWVRTHCAAVPAGQWQTASSAGSAAGLRTPTTASATLEQLWLCDPARS